LEIMREVYPPYGISPKLPLLVTIPVKWSSQLYRKSWLARSMDLLHSMWKSSRVILRSWRKPFGCCLLLFSVAALVAVVHNAMWLYWFSVALSCLVSGMILRWTPMMCSDYLALVHKYSCTCRNSLDVFSSRIFLLFNLSPGCFHCFIPSRMMQEEAHPPTSTKSKPNPNTTTFFQFDVTNTSQTSFQPPCRRLPRSFENDVAIFPLCNWLEQSLYVTWSSLSFLSQKWCASHKD
jgi:hypothetical protein